MGHPSSSILYSRAFQSTASGGEQPTFNNLSSQKFARMHSYFQLDPASEVPRVLVTNQAANGEF